MAANVATSSAYCVLGPLAILALGACLTLTACTEAPEAAPPPTASATVDPASTRAPSPAPGRAADPDALEECPAPQYWEDPYADGAPGSLATLGGLPMRIPVDLGPREYASGRAILDEQGVPVAYVAASGDIQEFVADRFCLGLAYLHNLNSVRRDIADGVGLFAGDTLNLNPYTVVSVGDQNGRVADNPPPDPLPPQNAAN